MSREDKDRQREDLQRQLHGREWNPFIHCSLLELKGLC